MMLITPVIVGIVVGIIMAFAYGRTGLLLRNVALGVVGALVFRIITLLLLGSRDSFSAGLSWPGFISSLTGAFLATFIAELFPPATLKDEKK